MTNRDLFESVFPSEITNVEFFGTPESGINCLIFTPEGNCWGSIRKNHSNIYDSFEDAYSLYKQGVGEQ